MQTIDRLLAQAHNALKVAEDAVTEGNETYTQLEATKASLQSKKHMKYIQIRLVFHEIRVVKQIKIMFLCIYVAVEEKVGGKEAITAYSFKQKALHNYLLTVLFMYPNTPLKSPCDCA